MLESMERRENVLREALEENDNETERWKTFIEGNETAINNMNMFSKKLTVDVMVPFGKKAFFPGRIIHTNEVLVAHYQDYFSECSTYVAIEICKQRIEKAKQRLIEIEGEKKLFQNKLEKPYMDGVLPNVEEREIIEEYDEESERIWREQHRQRVKDAKLKEKQEREEIMSKCAGNDIIQSLLEDDERSISELNDELNELETDYANETNKLLNKLITGEMKLPPPKKRIAHGGTLKRDDAGKLDTVILGKDNKSELSLNPTKIFENKTELEDDENDSDSSTSETPEEIRLIEKQGSFLPANHRIGFYQYHLEIIDEKLAKRKFTNSNELEEKLHLFKIRDFLEELLEETQPLDPDFETNVVEEKEGDIENNQSNAPKRRISFAMENQMLEFRKNETVAQMLPKENTPSRDIIQLDEPILNKEPILEILETKSTDPVEKRKTILEKVEENLINNNLEDADLVNKIIGSSANHIQTLHIHFKHSSGFRSSFDNIKTEIPRTPADFYSLFSNNESNDLLTKADNNFYLKESDRERAYIDVRSEFLAPNKLCEDNHSKSILKNKCAVEREKHIPEIEEKPKIIQKKQKKPAKEEEYLSAYNKVMGDVIENVTEPDPLPEEKFVDMHTPRKRISRFKQMRKENN